MLASSASFLAELSVSSPRKLFIFIIYKNVFRIKSSKKIFYLILKKLHWSPASPYSVTLNLHNLKGAVLLFQPKYRLSHPEKYLFSLYNKIFSGSKYPKNILFNFEKRNTGKESSDCSMPFNGQMLVLGTRCFVLLMYHVVS